MGPTELIRLLASQGRLSESVRTWPHNAVAVLRAAVFEIALPLVWERHTRPLEARKGHARCRTAIPALNPECLDGFTDDLEAVVLALLSYRRPIGNVEGWLSSRMANAIKDGNRVRRARDMGAQQRVRVPAQLAAALDDDRWLVSLAERILQWVGVRNGVTAGMWPLDAWAEDRARVTGQWGDAQGHLRVPAEVDLVLQTMRRWDASWYEKYVERPLGRKWTGVVGDLERTSPAGDWSPAETSVTWLDLVPRHERDDARLVELASTSLAMIRAALDAGDNPVSAVGLALEQCFLGDRGLARELGERPSAGRSDPLSAVRELLADPTALGRVAAWVMELRSQDTSGDPCGGTPATPVPRARPRAELS